MLKSNRADVGWHKMELLPKQLITDFEDLRNIMNKYVEYKRTNKSATQFVIQLTLQVQAVTQRTKPPILLICQGTWIHLIWSRGRFVPIQTFCFISISHKVAKVREWNSNMTEKSGTIWFDQPRLMAAVSIQLFSCKKSALIALIMSLLTFAILLPVCLFWFVEHSFRWHPWASMSFKVTCQEPDTRQEPLCNTGKAALGVHWSPRGAGSGESSEA